MSLFANCSRRRFSAPRILSRGAKASASGRSARGRSARDASSKALAAAAKSGSYDLFWFGQKGVGYDESLVGPMFAELMAVIGMANETNRLAAGYQVEIDERYRDL